MRSRHPISDTKIATAYVTLSSPANIWYHENSLGEVVKCNKTPTDTRVTIHRTQGVYSQNVKIR